MRQTTKVILPESFTPQQEQRTPAGQSGPKLAHVTEQPGLPIKFDSKRGCDQIRARLYHDPRLVGLELTVALALSEFVRLPACVAYPKQKLLVRMVHATRARVSNALQRLETKGVLTIDRGRSHCRYVFLETWRGRFQTVPRCAGKAHLDVPEKHISLEPYVLEPVRTSTAAAAAVLAAAVSPLEDGQQQQREWRIEGLIGACAARARKLKRPIDEDLERQRLASGEIDVEDLQRSADELQDEIDGRQHRGRR